MKHRRTGRVALVGALAAGPAFGLAPTASASQGRDDFRIEEATIEEIQTAILRRRITTPTW